MAWLESLSVVWDRWGRAHPGPSSPCLGQERPPGQLSWLWFPLWHYWVPGGGCLPVGFPMSWCRCLRIPVSGWILALCGAGGACGGESSTPLGVGGMWGRVSLFDLDLWDPWAFIIISNSVVCSLLVFLSKLFQCFVKGREGPLRMHRTRFP